MNFTAKELRRIDIICKYIDNEILREDAQIALEVKERQFRRIIRNFKAKGVESIKHGNFGRIPFNKTKKYVIDEILNLAQCRYKGFNIKHFIEKVEDEFLYSLPSYSTIRNIFNKNNLNQHKRRSKKRPHKARDRYHKEGIMIQIDGSYHKWFGFNKSCLIAAIDDATGKIVGAKFCKSETTFDTMDVVEQILVNYGRFQILYSDKAGVYTSRKREGYCNVENAMRKLNIIPMQAHTPQAKGKVERLFRTLQNRLISELRFNNIYTIEEANDFLQNLYINDFNEKFGKEPQVPVSAYSPLPVNINLNEILVVIENRVVQEGEVINYCNEKYIVDHDDCFSYKGKNIEIRKYRNNEVKFFLNNRKIPLKKIDQGKLAA